MEDNIFSSQYYIDYLKCRRLVPIYLVIMIKLNLKEITRNNHVVLSKYLNDIFDVRAAEGPPKT